jgi:hypothetical protein
MDTIHFHSPTIMLMGFLTLFHRAPSLADISTLCGNFPPSCRDPTVTRDVECETVLKHYVGVHRRNHHGDRGDRSPQIFNPWDHLYTGPPKFLIKPL